MIDYRDKVCVITGAGSGIGRELARQLAGQGARLALSDVNAAGLDETLAACTALGAEARAYRLDVSDWDAVHAHAAQVIVEFGQADVVFNNAGATLFSSFDHATREEIDWQLGVNLYGVINGCKAFLPHMLARKSGVLVNVSSVFGFCAFQGQSIYNISKFGVRGLTECLWQELRGTGVSAVSVHPGGIKTNIGKTARVGVNAGAFEARLAKGATAGLVTPPEDCARAILEGVRRGKRRVVTGHLSTLMSWLPRLLPDHYDAVLRSQIK